MSYTWTYSQLEQFETCPKQFYHKHVAKDFREPMGEAAKWGETVHKAFEDTIEKKVPLPEGMTQWQGIADKLAALPGQKYIELKCALNREYRPTGYFDKDWWTRGKADLVVINGNEAAVFDYKTGKMKPSEQLTLYAAYTFAHYPEVQVVHTGYVWLKNRKITKDKVQREELPFVWQGFIGRVSRLEKAYKANSWPESPSGLCNGWCPVKTCKYWKPKRGE